MRNSLRLILCLLVLNMPVLFTACPLLESDDQDMEDIIDIDTDDDTDANTGTGTYTLSWSDEFNGTSIDTDNWTYQVEPAGKYNNEWQVYTNSSDNCYVEDGSMVIEAIYNGEGLALGNFTSARMITWSHNAWKYGKISARIKLPYGQGIWPAFWMLGNNINENAGGTVPWPKCGEIDILEMIGGTGDRDSTAYGTLHYYNDNISGWEQTPSGIYTLDSGKFIDDYHIFGIEWTEDEFIWTVDGIEFNRESITTDMSEFKNDFYILLNLAVGGNWPGYPNSSTVFSQKMYVDWVRVYQK